MASFAGGLADGLRNGMAIAQAYERGERESELMQIDRQDRARRIAKEDEDKALEQEASRAMLGLQPGAPLPGVGQAGAIPAQGMASGALQVQQPAAAAQGGQAFGAPIMNTGMGSAIPNFQMPTGSNTGPKMADSPRMPDLGEAADGLGRAYHAALGRGRFSQAMDLLVQREKLVGQHRPAALAAAMTQFEATQDPNALVPFVNRYMPGALEVTSIERRRETGGGAPIYDLIGRDAMTGKEVRTPFSQGKLQSFLQTVADPATQQAMVAQQAKALFDLEVDRRKAEHDTQQKIAVNNAKPQVLGKDQVLYTPTAGGGMQRTAAGVDAGNAASKPVTSNKDFSAFVFKLHGVDSMEGLGADQRKQVGDQITIGENINRLNAGMPGGQVLSQGNLASLASRVQDGSAEIFPVELGEGQYGFATEHEGVEVRLPTSVVPAPVQAQVRQRILDSRNPRSTVAQAAPGAPAATSAPAPVSTSATQADQLPAGSEPAAQHLDAAREQLRAAQAALRNLTVNAPGLKAGRAARDAHSELIRAAQGDVDVARAAAQSAEQQWAQALNGSDVTRAAIGPR